MAEALMLGLILLLVLVGSLLLGFMYAWCCTRPLVRQFAANLNDYQKKRVNGTMEPTLLHFVTDHDPEKCKSGESDGLLTASAPEPEQDEKNEEPKASNRSSSSPSSSSDSTTIEVGTSDSAKKNDPEAYTVEIAGSSGGNPSSSEVPVTVSVVIEGTSTAS